MANCGINLSTLQILHRLFLIFFGITPPSLFKGIEQLPVTGHSFAHLLNEPEAKSKNQVQYLKTQEAEQLFDNWKAVTRHVQG